MERAVIIPVRPVELDHIRRETAWNGFTSWIDGIWNGIISTAESGWNGLITFLSQVWSAISTNASSAWDSLVKWFQGIPGDIVKAFTDLATDFENIGIDIINGIINGINSAASYLYNGVKDIGKNVLSAFSNAISSLSPSKKFHEQGEYIIQGLVDGMKAREPEAHAFMRNLGNQLSLTTGGGGTMTLASPGAGAAAYAGAAAGGGGVVQQFYIQGSVVAETELRQLAQQGALRYTRRNPGNGWFLPGRLS